MKKYNIDGGGGISLSVVLTIMFVLLKVIGTIQWSWVWVLSPLWITIALELVLIGVCVFIIKRRKRVNRNGRRNNQ